MKAKGWTQSDLARRIGLSRQAVSLWFRRDKAHLDSAHLLRLAEALGVTAEELSRPLPCFGADYDRLKTTLLWDRLYPDLDDFAIAAGRCEPQAIARLAHVYGLYATAKMVGDWAWENFPSYKRFIHPVRRRRLEILHEWNRRRQTAG